MNATKMAFDKFRAQFGPARSPPAEAIANEDELRPMMPSDGLQVWSDCNEKCNSKSHPELTPNITAELTSKTVLWVVRIADVVHAMERCEFGKSLQNGVIKHTNLTGGADAFCGGEMIIVDEATIIVNGKSRRYGPRSSKEMAEVAKTFTATGYSVWAMGYDEDAGIALPFEGTRPTWVA